MYVPVVNLSTENDKILWGQFKTGFKRTIKWNKYRSEMTNQTKNNILNYLIYVCYVMLCILYWTSMHKIVYNKKTNKYQLIDATITPGDQIWCLAAVVAAATYSDEVQATTTATTINNTVPVWEQHQSE